MPAAVAIPLITAAVGAGTTIAGAKMASGAAKSAAETQAQAGEQAATATADAQKYSADRMLEAAQQANSLQELMYILNRQDIAPYREVGGGALMTLQDLMQPQGYLSEVAPTFNFDVSKVAEDPGYEFAMKEGQKALERSAAAKGTLLSSSTAKALERYGNDYATTKVNDVFNRQLTQYGTNVNTENMNRTNLYNRLAGLAGIGQTAAGTSAGLGNQFASNVGNTTTGTAANIANMNMAGTNAQQNYLTSAAAARASGYVGGANAWSSALGGLSNLPYGYMSLSQLLKKPAPLGGGPGNEGYFGYPTWGDMP